MVFGRTILAAMTMTGFTALVPCVSDAGATTTASAISHTSAASTGVTTGPAACTKYGKGITLNVGFSEAGSTILSGFKSLVGDFETANPNVKVNVIAKSFTSSLQTIKLVMSSDNPPDVMQGNEGWSIDGALWQAHLLLNLNPYEKAYGWASEFPKSALTVNELTANGKILGEGDLTGVPQAIQYVGVYYNKALLKKIGITNPATLEKKANFLAALNKAKAAGLTPVELGDEDQWPALHNISLFNGWYESPQNIYNWVFDKKGATYLTAGRIQAATDMQDWMKEGYFNSNALSTTFADAEANFAQGDAVFFITGTWALGDEYAGLHNNVGFMLFPAGSSGKNEAVGGYSLPYTLSSKTKYPDCAAYFLNYITATKQAVAAQVASGRPSALLSSLNQHYSNPLLQEMVVQYKKLNAEGGEFNWEDWATPTMLTYSGAQAQLLIGGKITPKQYCENLQNNWAQYMKNPL
jgi:raffinose/stachyose/melibiose transport system substrate-binding protein